MLINAPMEKFLKKDAKFCWDEEFHKSFEFLKENMVTTPILIFPNWSKVFHMHVYASRVMVEAILAQLGAGEINQPIAYVSRKLSSAEQNYSNIEREGLVMPMCYINSTTTC